MAYGRRPRRKTWADSHAEWLASPAGSFDNARREMIANAAYGRTGDESVRWWAAEAMRIGREHGFDISGIEAYMTHHEKRVAARGY